MINQTKSAFSCDEKLIKCIGVVQIVGLQRFQGTNADQDNRFSDKEKKLLKQMKFEEVLSKKVAIHFTISLLFKEFGRTSKLNLPFIFYMKGWAIEHCIIRETFFITLSHQFRCFL